MADLKTLNYDANPPRCFNCKHRFTARTQAGGKKARTMMCSLAQQPVRTSAVCDGWAGYKGEVLDGVGGNDGFLLPEAGL